MKYISIGVVMAPSTEHILKVSHYRKKNAMTKLKLLVEGMNHGEEEN